MTPTDSKEVMKITRDGIWVNPDVSVDEAAKTVLAAIDKNILFLLEKERERERERCAKVCDEVEENCWETWDSQADPTDQGAAIGAAHCAAAIRARGQE